MGIEKEIVRKSWGGKRNFTRNGKGKNFAGYPIQVCVKIYVRMEANVAVLRDTFIDPIQIPRCTSMIHQ